MKDRFIKTIATFFFVGYLPLAPGTWGSLAGVLVYVLVRHNIYLFLSVFVILFSLGLYAAGKAEDIFGKKDDKKIVIDEVSGILLVYLLIPPAKLYLIIGFFLFRLFDMLKLYPAKKLEELPRSCGIMADDVVSALYSYVAISILVVFVRYL
jgi:phosphatidylglycerophosphatase A